jgi:hypothetical protein
MKTPVWPVLTLEPATNTTESNPDGRFPGGRGFAGQGPRGPMRDQRPGPSQQAANSVYSDGQGRFSITAPGAGRWRLTANAHGFRTQAYDQHEGFSSMIVLTAAEPTLSLTFRMTPDAVIDGLAFDEAGEAIRQGQVRAELLTADATGRERRQQTGFSQTDDRGHYEIIGLAPGLYKLSIQARPWYASGGTPRFGGPLPGASQATSSLDPSLDVVYPQTWYPAALDESSGETIDLKAGEARQADFHLSPVQAAHLIVPKSYAGAVDDDRNVRPPIVTPVNNSGNFMGPPTTRLTSAGWEIGGLAPGNYQIRLPGANGKEGDVLQVRANGATTTVGPETTVPTIKVSLQVEGVDPAQVRSITLNDVDTGQAYSAVGRRGGRLQMVGRGEDTVEEKQDLNQPRTILVPPHRYTVSLVGENLFLTQLTATGAKVAGRIVEIAGGTPTLTIHAGIGRGEITGLSKSAEKPAAGAMVLLIPATFGQEGSIDTVVRDQSNTDGSFELRNIIPGQYILVAIDHGWSVPWRDTNVLAKYLLSGTPVEVRPSARIRKDVEAVAP